MKIREKQIEVLDTFNMGNNYVSNLLDPVNAQDAATKSYVDAMVQGLNPKSSVLYTTVALENVNIAVGGLTQTLDGAVRTLNTDDRILLKNQTDNKQNGIYLAKAGTWVRSLDASTWAELISAFTFVEEGATLADTGWVCTIDAGGSLGIDPITFTQFSAAGSYTTDNQGIQVLTQQFSLVLDGDSLSKSGSGLKGATHTEEQYTTLTPTAGSPIVNHTTGVTIAYTPAGNCDVTVQLNGVTESISYGVKTGSFFFSGDGGVTAKAQADIVAGDTLWFNPIAAGYSLEATDTIGLLYSHIW
jgi:hypothetical protein